MEDKNTDDRDFQRFILLRIIKNPRVNERAGVFPQLLSCHLPGGWQVCVPFLFQVYFNAFAQT